MTHRFISWKFGWYCIPSRGQNPPKTTQKGREYEFSSQTRKTFQEALLLKRDCMTCC